MEDYSKRIKQRFPDFEKNWKEIVGVVGAEFVNYVKEKLTSTSMDFGKLSKFKFKIIVDNNFLFGQIKGLVTKKANAQDNFVYRLSEMESVNMYGPHLLQEEVIEKINLFLTGDEKVAALEHASVLLDRITILDAQWTDDWKKAKALIGHKDPDDVPYFALAFDIRSHAILSMDKMFDQQNEVRVWNARQTNLIVTSYHSGFISFTLTNKISELIAYLISIVFKFIRDMVTKLVRFVLTLTGKAIEEISKLDPWVLILLTIVGVVLWKDIKKWGKDTGKFMNEKSIEIIRKVSEALKELVLFLEQILDIIRLISTIAFEFLGFLISDFMEMKKKIDDLEDPQFS